MCAAAFARARKNSTQTTRHSGLFTVSAVVLRGGTSSVGYCEEARAAVGWGAGGPNDCANQELLSLMWLCWAHALSLSLSLDDGHGSLRLNQSLFYL